MDESHLRFELFLEHGDEAAQSLMHFFAPCLLRRLSVDPLPLAADIQSRELDVRWVRRPGASPEVASRLNVDWSGAQGLGIAPPSRCSHLPFQDVTEYAAVAMMALLLVHLEKASVQTVLPIGTGADYEVTATASGGTGAVYRVEVSGIHRADAPGDARRRLNEKCSQLLSMNPHGFASVTAFSLPPTGGMQSLLHFVRRSAAGGERAKKAGKRMSPTKTLADPKSKATALSAQGAAALLSGDTDTARERHTAAGDVLRASLKGIVKTADQHHTRFLAATQYFKAGRYTLALAQVRRIESRFLPPHAQRLFPAFAQEVRHRARSGYEQETRLRFRHHEQRNEFRELLNLIHHHPYLFDRDALAFVRTSLTFLLGEYEAAGESFAAAVRYGVTDPAMIMNFACMPYAAVAKRGLGLGLEEAWEAARALARGFPHATTELVASGLAYQLALKSRGEQRKGWATRQLDYYGRGIAKFAELPEAFQATHDVRFFAICIAASAAIAYSWSGDTVAAEEAVRTAERLGEGNPTTPAMIAATREFVRGAGVEPVTIPSELQKRWEGKGLFSLGGLFSTGSIR